MASLPLAALGLAAWSGACVPTGSAPPFDAGAVDASSGIREAADVLTEVFEENFDTSPAPVGKPVAKLDAGKPAEPAADAADGDAARGDAGEPAKTPAVETVSPLGPNWTVAQGSTAWRIDNGRLCGRGAKNHGVWLKKKLPINARVEFDAITDSADGDLKAEIWGDGRSGATAVSYTNATSYIAIFGGWKNSYHVLARKNEHGKDRKEIKVDQESDDPRQQPASVGQVYRFKIERNDGRTVRFSVNDVELASYTDGEPLVGIGHDHLGFNNWSESVTSCFDNIKITPL